MHSSESQNLKRSWVAGLFLSLFGYRLRGFELSGDKLTLLAGSSRSIPFAEISGPAQVDKTLGFSSVVVPVTGGRQVEVVGVNAGEATQFVSSLNGAWRLHFAEQLARVRDELLPLSAVIYRLRQPKRFPSACLLQPFLDRTTEVLRYLPTQIPDATLNRDDRAVLDAVIAFHRDPDPIRRAAIEAFVTCELAEMREFFDTIESNPLTPEQRLAVVTDEDATLVLAGAGSGKTSVIVAKAAYLIQRGIRKPHEILLMAFGKDAAAEMATRIEERSGAAIDAKTFHALGYEIIRQVENGAPALAPHASDESQFRVLLRDVLARDVATQPDLAALLLTWFSEFYWPYKGEWDFKTKDEYFQYVEAHELRTLQGELVRSFEEWEIANWLYLNGIAYEYEPDYEHDLPNNDRRAYTPDFRLTDSGVYIEHFGVRKARQPDGTIRLVTAPYIDQDTYLEGMEWKRQVHAEHGTVLIETYSYERVEGRLTEALQEKLAPYATPGAIPSDQVFDILNAKGQVDSFTQILGTFLRHFKSSGNSIENCRARAEQSADAPRSRAFLTIFEAVFDAYQRRLGSRIDFEDMIVRATEHVRSGRFQSPYRHLLVDEFQDISAGRAQLLKALKNQHADARIFAVGDDWQSIYRFTGSDIHLMRNFGREFGGAFAGNTGVHQTVDLGRTFRSVDKIALPARDFVLKNPSQITKQVIPAGQVDLPAIKVIYYTRRREEEGLRSALTSIQAPPSGRKASVLLLGRYHFVKPDNLASIAADYPWLSVRFMTVHASKGLEADHAIILQASSGRLGFPSEIVDDPLIDLVLPEPEKFDHAEERRLFYVALTRARKSVVVVADRDKPSAFAREFIDGPDFGALEIGETATPKHRCGSCGGRMLAHSARNGSTYFSCEHQFLCGERRRPCNACGKDLPSANQSMSGEMVCSCGAAFPACPDCSDGWLVERRGRYGKFLGCVRYPDCNGTQQILKPNSH
jgi:DNA helicase-4